MIPARSREGIKFPGGHKALPYDEDWGVVQELTFMVMGRAAGAWGIAHFSESPEAGRDGPTTIYGWR